MDGVGESVGAAALGLSFAAQGSATQESVRARQSSSPQESSAPIQQSTQQSAQPVETNAASETGNKSPVSAQGSVQNANVPIEDKPVSRTSEDSQDKKNKGGQDDASKNVEKDRLQFQLDNTALQYRFVDTAPAKKGPVTTHDSSEEGAKIAPAKQLVVVVVNEETGDVVRQIPPPPPKYFTDDEFKNKIRIGSHMDRNG